MTQYLNIPFILSLILAPLDYDSPLYIVRSYNGKVSYTSDRWNGTVYNREDVEDMSSPALLSLWRDLAASDKIQLVKAFRTMVADSDLKTAKETVEWLARQPFENFDADEWVGLQVMSITRCDEGFTVEVGTRNKSGSLFVELAKAPAMDAKVTLSFG